MTETEGYERLGAAIVAQACRDVTSYPGDVRRFFCDKRSIFDLCMPTADGQAIYKKLMESCRNRLPNLKIHITIHITLPER